MKGWSKAEANLIKAMISDTGYTYVSLRLGTPFIGHYETCGRLFQGWHITNGYVAAMSQV